MAKRIFKYTVPIDDKPHRIPVGKVLHVAHGDLMGEVRVWVEHTINLSGGIMNDDAIDRYIQVFGTGQEIPDVADLEYLGTALTPINTVPLVWHAYEVRRRMSNV